MSDSQESEKAVLSNAFNENEPQLEFEDELVDRSDSSESSSSPPSPASRSWKRQAGKTKRRRRRSNSDEHSSLCTPGSPLKNRATADKVKKNLQNKFDEASSADDVQVPHERPVLAEIGNNGQLKDRKTETPECGTEPKGTTKKGSKRHYNTENDKTEPACKTALKDKFELSKNGSPDRRQLQESIDELDSLSLHASDREFHTSEESE